ncbi:MAG: radical SAM protein [Synergistaceae bacterium]|nr:radical SAM protein [Synergistaceae bacterium]
MRIVLIYPKPDEEKHPRFGFSYRMMTAEAVLSRYHTATVKDYSCEEYAPEVFGGADLLIVECDSFALKRSQNLRHAGEIIGAVRGKVPVIAYGHHCCITGRDFHGADFTVKDNSINSLVRAVNMFADGEQPRVPEIPDYDSLPYINREKLRGIKFYGEGRNRISTLIQTAEGCGNTCVFCQRKGWQKNYTAHSDDYVLGELGLIRSQGYSNVWVTDENFTYRLPRVKRLLRKIYAVSFTEGMNLFISSWANIDTEFLDLAAECNIRIISFGIESGSQEILGFYRKNIDLQRVPELIHYADSLGIFTAGNFILGAPMETEGTIAQTFALIRECGFDQINIKTLDCMEGSELYEELDDSLKAGKNHVFACAENGLNDFALEDIRRIKHDFMRSYYAENQKRIAGKIAEFGLPFA